MIQSPNIHDWVLSEEAKFETDEIKVGDNWYWNFKKHVQLLFHLVNGIFYTGENNWLRAFKNIMEPILELSFWTEDIEVKDVVFTIDDNKALSFLIKKYHDEIYVKEHDLDSLFDEITESDLTYGGVLVQKGAKRPEIVPLNSVAFCDQTDILGGVIAFKYYFAPSKLKEMSKKGWGEEKNGATITIDELCTLATAEKDSPSLIGDKRNQIPTKNIEVYLIIGDMPEHYLEENDEMDYYCPQVQVVAEYYDKDSNKQGVTLYRKKAEDEMVKFFTSKSIYQRALGRGVGERLLHPQIWTNFLTIHKMNMLEAGSKTPLVTDDPSWTQKNKIQDMENLEVTVIEEGRSVNLIPTVAPANIQLFANDINDWYGIAENAGDAQAPLRGDEPVSGTTFRGQERLVAQGRGPHDRRKGKRAKFIEEIYRDWIIPDIVKEITKGKKFLATLSTEDLNWVADTLATNHTNKIIKEMILKGKMVSPEEQAMISQTFKDDFFKKGNKHLLEILKDEAEDVEIKLGINVANKQKNLADLSDKLLSIFQFIFANPQAFQSAMQIPAMAKSFENILEFSGMSIGDFSSLLKAPQMQPQLSPMQPENMPQQSPQMALNQPQ